MNSLNEHFFTEQQTQSKLFPDGKLRTCVTCGLLEGNIKTRRMEPFGNFRKGILNIGEAPGAEEDRLGKPWKGKVGQALEVMYKKLGVDLFEDCLNINACNCRPVDNKGNNRAPTNDEIAACRQRVLKVIHDRRPKMIILLGNAAIQSLLGYRWKKNLGGIYKWRGWTIPDRDFNCWICPTFHPSYVERSEQEVETIWKQDLRKFFSIIDEPLPEHIMPEVEVIDDLSVLNEQLLDTIAIDYETTGLKPHVNGHRIVCVAIADTPDHCYAFMLPKTRKESRPLFTLLANPQTSKIAHNMKYEEVWSAVRLKQSIENWSWDAMLAAHVLDNRPGITNLQFQVYVNFGVIDYKDETAPYLESGSKDGNAMNRIYELLKKPDGKRMLLNRCGLDAIYEYRLAMKQMKEIN